MSLADCSESDATCEVVFEFPSILNFCTGGGEFVERRLISSSWLWLGDGVVLEMFFAGSSARSSFTLAETGGRETRQTLFWYSWEGEYCLGAGAGATFRLSCAVSSESRAVLLRKSFSDGLPPFVGAPFNGLCGLGAWTSFRLSTRGE